MFKVAIPSYNRSDVIMDKTLATLRRGGVALSDVYIFVVDDEKESYQTACPGYQIIVGLKGLVHQRAFIQGFFSEHDTIVMMDDDIEEIFRPIDCKTKQQISDLPGLFHLMNLRMKSEGVSICGIYPCNNLKFALGNPEITTDFRYLVGAFYLIRNLKLPEVQLESSDESHEDKIRTIKYYQKEEKCLRYNWVLIKTKYFAKGGLDSPDRLKQHAIDAEALCLRFPLYLRLQKTRKITDAKFRRIKI
jgi:hypothetical protein